MPSIEANYNNWNSRYVWKSQGDEWSEAWGSAIHQWYTMILPRIYHFLPSDHILEIGPGQGRWTQFLVPNARKLSVVDLSENCINHCRKRFSGVEHLQYFVNDGKSLEGIASHSVDFVFSFDSLVHAEYDVMCAYLQEFGRVLRPGGAAVIHHSNLASFENSVWIKLRNRLARYSGIPVRRKKSPHWRASTVSADLVKKAADNANIRCIGQEIFSWINMRKSIDCISVLQKNDALPTAPIRFENRNFLNDIELSRDLLACYKPASL